MHAGPLGPLLDITASDLMEHCFDGTFGFTDVVVWKDRVQAQLNTAHAEFSTWAKASGQQHTIKRFTRCGFSMYTLGSWPCYKGKAHNTLVLARWLESKTKEIKDVSEYCALRWHVLWAWVEWFDVRLTADPDFLEPGELGRLGRATVL